MCETGGMVRAGPAPNAHSCPYIAAGGWPQLKAALENGADAVYFGGMLGQPCLRQRPCPVTTVTLGPPKPLASHCPRHTTNPLHTLTPPAQGCLTSTPAPAPPTLSRASCPRSWPTCMTGGPRATWSSTCWVGGWGGVRAQSGLCVAGPTQRATGPAWCAQPGRRCRAGCVPAGRGPLRAQPGLERRGGSRPRDVPKVPAWVPSRADPLPPPPPCPCRLLTAAVGPPVPPLFSV